MDCGFHFIQFHMKNFSVCECNLLQMCQKFVTEGIFSISAIWVIFFINFYLRYVFACSAGSLNLADQLESRNIQFFLMTHD